MGVGGSVGSDVIHPSVLLAHPSAPSAVGIGDFTKIYCCYMWLHTLLTQSKAACLWINKDKYVKSWWEHTASLDTTVSSETTVHFIAFVCLAQLTRGLFIPGWERERRGRCEDPGVLCVKLMDAVGFVYPPDDWIVTAGPSPSSLRNNGLLEMPQHKVINLS